MRHAVRFSVVIVVLSLVQHAIAQQTTQPTTQPVGGIETVLKHIPDKYLPSGKNWSTMDKLIPAQEAMRGKAAGQVVRLTTGVTPDVKYRTGVFTVVARQANWVLSDKTAAVRRGKLVLQSAPFQTSGVPVVGTVVHTVIGFNETAEDGLPAGPWIEVILDDAHPVAP